MRSAFVALACVSALATGVGLPATLLMCRVEERIHARCCCAGKARAPQDEGALRRAPCCTGVVVATASSSNAPPEPAVDRVSPVLVEVVQPGSFCIEALGESAARTVAAFGVTPRAVGPPHRIMHCSLLL